MYNPSHRRPSAVAALLLLSWLGACEPAQPPDPPTLTREVAPEPDAAPAGLAPSPDAASAPASAPHSEAASAPGGHDHGGALAAESALPGRSIFQLEGQWDDQEGRRAALATLRGRPTLIVMFYGTCLHVCPILVRDAQRVEEALSPQERERLQVVLVTIDPQRDTTQALRQYAQDKKLDPKRWRLLRGEETQIRELAAVLGIKYRAHPDGSLSHSNLLTLLNAEGEVAERLEGLNQPVEGLVAQLRAMP